MMGFPSASRMALSLSLQSPRSSFLSTHPQTPQIQRCNAACTPRKTRFARSLPSQRYSTIVFRSQPTLHYVDRSCVRNSFTTHSSTQPHAHRRESHTCQRPCLHPKGRWKVDRRPGKCCAAAPALNGVAVEKQITDGRHGTLTSDRYVQSHSSIPSDVFEL